MSPAELDLLVRWMTHDYPETHVEDYPSLSDELPPVGDATAAKSEPKSDAAPAPGNETENK